MTSSCGRRSPATCGRSSAWWIATATWCCASAPGSSARTRPRTSPRTRSCAPITASGAGAATGSSAPGCCRSPTTARSTRWPRGAPTRWSSPRPPTRRRTRRSARPPPGWRPPSGAAASTSSSRRSASPTAPCSSCATSRGSATTRSPRWRTCRWAASRAACTGPGRSSPTRCAATPTTGSCRDEHGRAAVAGRGPRRGPAGGPARGRAARRRRGRIGDPDRPLAAPAAPRVRVGRQRGGQHRGRAPVPRPPPAVIATVLDSAADSVGAFIPRAAGALVLLVVGLIVVSLLRRALVKLLRAAGVDDAGERWGASDVLERFGLSRSLSAVLGGAVRVGLVLVVVFAALSLLGLQFLSASLNAAILYLPRVLLAFLLLLAGMVISELVRRQVDRLTTQMDVPGPIGALAQAVVLAVFVVTALAQVGVPTQILLVLVAVLLAGAAATLALAFGIGGREMAREVSARRYVEGAFAVGQEITVSEVRGRIAAIESTSTVLETGEGERVRVPNSQLIAGVVRLH